LDLRVPRGPGPTVPPANPTERRPLPVRLPVHQDEGLVRALQARASDDDGRARAGRPQVPVHPLEHHVLLRSRRPGVHRRIRRGQPRDFLDLVMELRESQASGYTLRDTPTFTCVQMSLWDMLDTLGGAGSAEAPSRRPVRADGYTPVATLAELPEGASRRVYAAGEAVALFNVSGTVHAIANRCTHARASLSEGTLDPARCGRNTRCSSCATTPSSPRR